MPIFKAPTSTREVLAQGYAYIYRAAVARKQGAEKFTRTHHILARRFYNDVMAGRKRIDSLFRMERARLGQELKCSYCGQKGCLSMDHLIPRFRGGPDDGSNLVPACRPCNSSKGSRDLMAWLAIRREAPSDAVLQRYIKLAWRWCDRQGRLDDRLEESEDMPFDLVALANFPWRSLKNPDRID